VNANASDGAIRISHGRLMQLSFRSLPTLLAALLLLAAPHPVWPQDEAHIPREHHAWARFAPGSWKLVRIVTENFDPQGRVSTASVTETRTTLKEASPVGFTLLIESTVELDGKRIVSEPQQVAQHYNGALRGQMAHSRVLGEEAVTIGGKSYPCRVHRYEINGAGQKTVTRTHYSSEVAPYVLRRETTALDTANNAPTSRLLVEVKELNVPHLACGQTHLAARMRVAQTHAKGRETTEALSSVRVPGGVIWHDSTLVDPAGLKLSHSKLDLIDYQAIDHPQPRRDARLAHPAPLLALQGEGNLFGLCRGLRNRWFERRCGQ
jgi:hypothetical protein